MTIPVFRNPKHKPIIYLDLDGVIAEFVVTAMRHHGAPITSDGEYPDNCEWDIVKATNMLRGTINLPPLSATKFWDALGHDFYATLPFYPGALNFIDGLEDIGDVYLATSVTLTPGCSSGKQVWIDQYLPKYKRRSFLGARKEHLSQEGRILIDDRDLNCDRFERDDNGNYRGGHAVLVPRPWNRAGYDGRDDFYAPLLTEIRGMASCI
jgi:5'(3')-deoxyribonucleotidase